MTDNESWIKSLESNYYMYDVDSNQLSVIDVPDKKAILMLLSDSIFKGQAAYKNMMICKICNMRHRYMQ